MSFYHFAQKAAKPATGLLFDVRMTGAERVPASGALVVAANHRSYIDPPLLGSWFPRDIEFMAKRELFRIPLVGHVLRALRAFPVDRDRGDPGAIKRALQILRRGGVVGIFPEGTRNLDGEAKARGGAVLLASMAGCPLVPVALVNTGVAMARLRASKVEVRIGEPIVLQGSARRATKAEIERWTADLTAAIDRLADQPSSARPQSKRWK